MKKKVKAKTRAKVKTKVKAKTKVKGKAKTGRKRAAVKDLAAKKAATVKGGLLPAVSPTALKVDYKSSPGLLLPAVPRAADGSV